MHKRIGMDQFHRSGSDRYALFIRVAQLSRSESKQRTHPLSRHLERYSAWRHAGAQGQHLRGKQDLQGSFYAYLAASRPILEISDHQYRTGRNFSVYQPPEDAPVVAHPVT